MTKRYLGVDYGDKRIGLAIAEDDVKVARPLQIIEPGQQSVTASLGDVVKSEGITDIVLGLPRNLDGDDTAQTGQVRSFARELESLGLPVTFQDEAATSKVARQQYPGKTPIDAEAAAIILQDYLENL